MFLIKKNNLYFYNFKDYTTYEGYLDKKHPLKTLFFVANQYEGMIDCSEKNFKHMCNGILKVTINTLNRFLRNPYEVSWFTRRKIMMNYENYFRGAGME